MPIRLRLALWYGTLFAVLLTGVAVLSYAFHTRGHYDDIDGALVTVTSHSADTLAANGPSADLLEGANQFRVILRIYAPDGTLQRSSISATNAPQIDPRQVERTPAGPAFDPIAGVAPPIVALHVGPGGAFGLLTSHAVRWRVYVQPILADGHITGYVEGLAPLGAVDAAIGTYRLIMLGISLGGLAAALAGSCLVAGVALRPVRRVTATAAAIARSQDLSQHLAEPPFQDEIGQLSRTFNVMLTSIAQASEAQRRFVADASHELRAPLTAIQANLDLLLHHPDAAADERTEALTEAERESARLGRLVADLLTLARADAGIAIRHDVVDLDAVMLDSFRVARSLVHEQKLTLDPFTSVQVMGDADRLKQLLIILLDNALKFTPPGGSVTLGLEQCTDRATVTVHDTGTGIAPDALPHVFERFYRADPGRNRATSGTGLGLAIAQWIVQQHDGTIAITSTEEDGTTVTVTLPCASAF